MPSRTASALNESARSRAMTVGDIRCSVDQEIERPDESEHHPAIFFKIIHEGMLIT